MASHIKLKTLCEKSCKYPRKSAIENWPKTSVKSQAVLVVTFKTHEHQDGTMVGQHMVGKSENKADDFFLFFKYYFLFFKLKQ